jgi:hypothetical protein
MGRAGEFGMWSLFTVPAGDEPYGVADPLLGTLHFPQVLSPNDATDWTGFFLVTVDHTMLLSALNPSCAMEYSA